MTGQIEVHEPTCAICDPEPTCAICDRGFSVREWVRRHEVVDGPCHEVCCDDCPDEDDDR